MTTAAPKDGKYPVAPKVKWMAIGTYALGVLMTALFGAVTDGNLLYELPDWATTLLVPVLPMIGNFVLGYNIRHQWRTPERNRIEEPGRAVFASEEEHTDPRGYEGKIQGWR